MNEVVNSFIEGHVDFRVSFGLYNGKYYIYLYEVDGYGWLSIFHDNSVVSREDIDLTSNYLEKFKKFNSYRELVSFIKKELRSFYVNKDLARKHTFKIKTKK